MHRIAAVFFALSVVALPLQAQEKAAKQDPLAALRFLTGWCWHAPFPDGKATDTHCFENVYDGAFIRDTHVVKSDGPDYRGETLYAWQAKEGVIGYRYWSSIGGVSDGTAVPSGGEILFPGESHVTAEGKSIEMQSRMKPDGDDAYIATSEQKMVDGSWKELWTMRFVKLRPSSDGAPAARQQAEKLEALAGIVGDWANPDDVAKARDERRAPKIQMAYHYGPRKMLLRAFEGLGAFSGETPDPVLEGIIFWDHVTGQYEFSASTRYGWTFSGNYDMAEDGSVTRTYDVHYAEGEDYIPKPELGGQTRRFREIYRFLDADHLKIQLDIWQDEDWQPFGPGSYEAVRVSSPKP